jgi:hypothetical protein
MGSARDQLQQSSQGLSEGSCGTAAREPVHIVDVEQKAGQLVGVVSDHVVLVQHIAADYSEVGSGLLVEA